MTNCQNHDALKDLHFQRIVLKNGNSLVGEELQYCWICRYLWLCHYQLTPSKNVVITWPQPCDKQCNLLEYWSSNVYTGYTVLSSHWIFPCTFTLQKAPLPNYAKITVKTRTFIGHIDICVYTYIYIHYLYHIYPLYAYTVYYVATVH